MRAPAHLALAALVLGSAACNGDSSGPSNIERYTASLTGAAERPNPVITNASGNATVRLNTTTKTFEYTINVSNITGVNGAHIHGPATTEQAAGVLVPLNAPTSGGSSSGTFDASNITAANVSVDSLIALMRAGRTYINVHTNTNPGGEVRGQLNRVN